MNTLRQVGLVRLMKWSLMPALLAGSVAPCLAAEPVELALRQPAHASRIVLDLSKRQITLMRGEQQLGAWPVAIGDPKTPTPKGEFAILNKKVNPTYVTLSRVSGGSCADPAARLVIATWLFTAMAAASLGFMERRGRTGFRFVRP